MRKLAFLSLLLALCRSGATAQPARVRPDTLCEQAKAQKDATTLAFLRLKGWMATVDDEKVTDKEWLKYSSRVYSLLDSLLRLPKVVQYDISCLLQPYASISVSPDRRLWLIRWRERPEGTFRCYSTVWHVRNKDGGIVPGKKNTLTTGNGQTNILWQTDSLTSYVIEEQVQTCAMCYQVTIAAVQVTDAGGVAEIQRLERKALAPMINLDRGKRSGKKTVVLEYVVGLSNYEPALVSFLDKHSKTVRVSGADDPYIGKWITETWAFNGREFVLLGLGISDAQSAKKGGIQHSR